MEQKVGLSVPFGCLNDAFFNEMKTAGISAVEISPAAEDYARLDFAAIRSLAEKHGIELWSFHLPFGPFETVDPSALSAAKRKYTLDYFSGFIRKAAAVGIKRIVFHASAEPIPEDERAQRLANSCRFLTELADVAQAEGAVIAVEDLPRSCIGHNSDEILALIGDHPALGVCFDTNHLLMEENTAFVRRVGSRLVTIHVSDFDFINERHWLPGEGRIDWKALRKALDEVGYRGVWMYEISLAATKTISRERPLQPSDFVCNARELAQGLPLTVRGVPYEHLGMWGPEQA